MNMRFNRNVNVLFTTKSLIYLFKAVMCICLNVDLSRGFREQGFTSARKPCHAVRNDEKYFYIKCLKNC